MAIGPWGVDDPVLRDAVALSQSLVRLPNQNEDLDFGVSYNLWE